MVLLVRFGRIDLSADVSGEFMAVMFLAFLVVVATKVCYFGIVTVEKEIDDE